MGLLKNYDVTDLDNPKSQIFISQFEFISIFDGFRSLCTIPPLWRYFNAQAS